MILTTFLWGVIGPFLFSLMWGFAASTVGIGFTVGVCLHVVVALVVTIFGWDR